MGSSHGLRRLDNNVDNAVEPDARSGGGPPNQSETGMMVGGDVVHGDKIVTQTAGGDIVGGDKIVGYSAAQVATLYVQLRHEYQPKPWESSVFYAAP